MCLKIPTHCIGRIYPRYMSTVLRAPQWTPARDSSDASGCYVSGVNILSYTKIATTISSIDVSQHVTCGTQHCNIDVSQHVTCGTQHC